MELRAAQSAASTGINGTARPHENRCERSLRIPRCANRPLCRRHRSDALGVIKTRHPRTFHPGTRIAGEASIIEIGEGTRVELQPFRLPPALKAVKLSGNRLRGLMEPPAAGVSVSLRERRSLRAARRYFGTTRTPKGDSRFTIHEGLSYIVQELTFAGEGSSGRQFEVGNGTHSPDRFAWIPCDWSCRQNVRGVKATPCQTGLGWRWGNRNQIQQECPLARRSRFRVPRSSRSSNTRAVRNRPYCEDALDDFQFYLREIHERFDESAIRIHECYRPSFEVEVRGQKKQFTQNSVGYYLISPDKEPRVEVGVVTDADLVRLMNRVLRGRCRKQGCRTAAE